MKSLYPILEIKITKRGKFYSYQEIGFRRSCFIPFIKSRLGLMRQIGSDIDFMEKEFNMFKEAKK